MRRAERSSSWGCRLYLYIHGYADWIYPRLSIREGKTNRWGEAKLAEFQAAGSPIRNHPLRTRKKQSARTATPATIRASIEPRGRHSGRIFPDPFPEDADLQVRS